MAKVTDLADVPDEVRNRIIAAAEDLLAKSDDGKLPTVDVVRSAARTDANATGLVMREWRAAKKAEQTAPVIVVELPERVQQSLTAMGGAVWKEAQDLANETLHAARLVWDEERDSIEDDAAQVAHANASEKDELRADMSAAKAAAEAAEATAKVLRDERDEARKDAATARERAAILTGELNKLDEQNKALLERVGPPEQPAKLR